MVVHAKEGMRLAQLVKMAIPICQRAERLCPRTGPGRKPIVPDWAMAVMIMTAVAKRIKSKSGQYRFIDAHREAFVKWLGIERVLARSSYFDRYRRAQRILEEAIFLLGRRAIAWGLVDEKTVAIDKSVIPSLGPAWNKSDRERGRVPKGLRGVDCDSEWVHTKTRGWIQGYSYEVAVSAGKQGLVFPLSASADTAAACECLTVQPKIKRLPKGTKNVLADAAYDSIENQRLVENRNGKRSGARFYCPVTARGRPRRGESQARIVDPERIKRNRRMQTRTAKRIFRRRSTSVEPFNDWFKTAFALHQHVWHRGLDNNRTQILAAIFAYQLIVCLLNKRRPAKERNCQVHHVLDAL